MSLLSQPVDQFSLLATRGTRRKSVNGLTNTSPLPGKCRKRPPSKVGQQVVFMQDKQAALTRIFVTNDCTENTFIYNSEVWECPELESYHSKIPAKIAHGAQQWGETRSVVTGSCVQVW